MHSIATAMKYKVALKKSREGYSVSCPALPGCWSQGKKEDEALENIQAAIRGHVKAAIKISKGVKVREVEVAVCRAEAVVGAARAASWFYQ